VATPLPWLKPGLVVGGLAPLAALAALGAAGQLGADPIATALNRLGLMALVLLLASLTCTPLKLFFGWAWPLRIRRALGLLAFTYVAAHFLLYALIDQGAKLGDLVADVVKRPFITVGFVAFVLLVPLAWTSTDAAVRRLGFVRWQRLHRLAYVATALGALHFFLRVKKDVSEPMVYIIVLLGLFGVRVIDRVRAGAKVRA
jgi:methionine sulfoxide reductase heme-binding subunit